MSTKKISINDLTQMLSNKSYKRFYKEKLKIQKKYDKRLFDWRGKGNQPYVLKAWYHEEGYIQWREYLKEIGELVFKNKDFQQFIWDTTSETEKAVRERRTREPKY